MYKNFSKKNKKGKILKGLVTRVFGRYYTVKHGNDEIRTVLRGKLKTHRDLKRFSSPVAVGDMVEFSLDSDSGEGPGAIESIGERKNIFSRKDRVKGKEDLIAVNIDLVVVVQSFSSPALNLRFVDRLLVRGEKEGVAVILCVNKDDLAQAGDHSFIERYYANTGLRIFFTSVTNNTGISRLGEEISRKRSLLVGYSGVGKSSLMNKLYSGINLKTSDVSQSTGKGRHTTTNVRLVQTDDGTELIDTPGVREFGLMDIEPNSLGQYFRDFRSHAERCRFTPCSHDHEPGCAVKELVESGEICEERHISYLNILHSLRENYENMY